MKQTAVDWLVQELINSGLLYPISEMSKTIEQAKAMEADQINKACYDGYYQEGLYDVRQYYNQTYKTEK